MKQTHVVHKIPCNTCNKRYLGQTSQHIQERINAPKNAKTTNTGPNKHKIGTNHDNYQTSIILDNPQNIFKRNV